MMPFMTQAAQQSNVPPNQIADLKLWYNASASSTAVGTTTTQNFNNPVVNGTPIATWNDLSGLGHPSNAQGGQSAYPTYSIPIQNGLGSVTYNAALANNLDINPISWAQGLSGMTIYVCARPTSFPGTVFPLLTTDTNWGVWWNGTNWSVGQSVGNFASANIVNDTSKFHIYGFTFDGTQSSPSMKLQFRYDRKAVAPVSYTGTIGTTTGNPKYFYFGGDSRSAGQGGATFASKYMDGYIGEVMIWTRALTPVQQQQAENYLNQKWGLGYN